MSVSVLSLYDLLKNKQTTEEFINGTILRSFSSRKLEDSTKPHDVEEFIHKKAITFEKSGISRTYLVFDTYEDQSTHFAGYFTIANKNLVIHRGAYSCLSEKMRKQLMGFGYKTEQNNYNISAILIGQIGKNYSEEVVSKTKVSGDILMNEAMDKVMDSHRISGGRIVYLECDNHPKLIAFYNRHGFVEIPGYQSANGYCVMIRKLSV